MSETALLSPEFVQDARAQAYRILAGLHRVTLGHSDSTRTLPVTCLARWHVRLEGLKYTRFRSLTALSRGQTPGPEGSIAKLVLGPQGQEVARLATDLQEAAGGILNDAIAAASGQYAQNFLGSPGLRIAAGTDDILRNTIAERVLGLPQDIRVDKDLPFNKIPTGR